jgi:O-antigen ligase
VIALIGFGGLLAFYSILQRVEDPSSIYGLRQSNNAVPFGTYVNRHHFAALMEMTLGLSLGLLFAGELKRTQFPFLIVAAGVMATAIMLTGSRGGILSVVCLMTSIAVLRIWRKRDPGRSNGKVVLTLGFSLLFALTAVALVVFLGGSDQLARTIDVSLSSDDFSTGRRDFWKVGWHIFVNNPITGAGFDAFGTAFSKYDPSSGLMRVEQAHNDYLQMLADGGVVAFACVVGFIFLLVRKSLRTIRETSDGFPQGASIGAFAGCAAIVVHSFVDFPLRTTANGFVFLMLAGIAVTPIVKHSRRRKRPLDQRTVT